MKPRTHTKDGLLHIRYDLPQLINVAKIYPRTSRSGSSIIVCGHERGLALIWRKSQHLDTLNEAHHGIGSDNATQFGSGEERDNIDVEHIQQDAVYCRNLDIGTAVLHLAFPRISPKSTRQSPLPPLLEDKMLIAVACSDFSVRLLSLPLSRPEDKPFETGNTTVDFNSWFNIRANWIDEMVAVPASRGHHSLPKGISIALTHRPISSIEGDEDIPDSPRSGRLLDEWDVLIASHSTDNLGKLLVHRIPISPSGEHIEEPPLEDILWRSERLHGSVSSVQIHVPPNTKDHQAIPRVLVALCDGPVKIYECSTTDDDRRGIWHIVLYPGNTVSDNVMHTRMILDCQWVLGGNGICVLLRNGQWGIWDVSPSGLAHTISGNASTKFTLDGWIESARSVSSSKTQSGSNQKRGSRHDLAPMTPGTRKVRQESLFSAHTISTNTASPLEGGIIPQLTKQSIEGHDDDESLLIWHGSRMVSISSLRSHWRSKVRTSNVHTQGSIPLQTYEVATALTPNERCIGVSMFHHEDSVGDSLRGLHNDILVACETEFTIVAAPTQKRARLVPEQEAMEAELDDQELLAQGGLDIHGLDRLLHNMGDVPMEDMDTVAPGSKRVGFVS